MMDHIVRHMPGNYNEMQIGFCNLKYNWTVIRRYLRGIYQLVKKEKQYYSVHLWHKKVKVVLFDTYKLITTPLRDFFKKVQSCCGKERSYTL